MTNERIGLNITLDKTTPISCDKCGNDTFVQVVRLRVASKFLTGTDQDALIPIPVFACSACNHVNEQFEPKDQN